MLRKLTILTFFSLIFSTLISTYEAEATTTSQVVTISKKYIGVPYVYGGTTTRGFDCSGYLNYVYDQVGVDLPRTAADIYKVGQAVGKSNLQQGDLVFFETYKPGVSHAGIYIGESKFIHASSSKGVTISSINDPYYWKSKYVGAKRVLKATPAQKPALPIGDYYDVKSGSWSDSAISTLSKRGIIKGYNVSLFKPNNALTRAQAAEMLANTFKLSKTDKKKVFNDVPSNHWAAGSIKAVEKAGYFTGDTKNNFRPNEPITREQMAVVLARAFKLSSSNSNLQFVDVPSNAWSHDAVQSLAAHNVTVGYPDKTFKPRNVTTRAQFSVFLYRALY